MIYSEYSYVPDIRYSVWVRCVQTLAVQIKYVWLMITAYNDKYIFPIPVSITRTLFVNLVHYTKIKPYVLYFV